MTNAKSLKCKHGNESMDEYYVCTECIGLIHRRDARALVKLLERLHLRGSGGIIARLRAIL